MENTNRFANFLLVGFFAFLIFTPVPASAGIGEAYLKACRWGLSRAGWMNSVSLPDNVYWVKEPRELTPVSDALVDAFSEDPLFNWTTPDPELRRKLIYTLVRHAYMNGGVLTTRSPGTAAALWFESEKASAGPLSILLTGQLVLIPQVGFGHTLNVLKLDDFMVKTRKRLLSEAGSEGDSIYLYMVGVREEARGQGIASELIRPVLEYADVTRQPVLLETHKLSNVPIYEHLGFEIRSQKAVPETAPVTSSMMRLPKIAESQAPLDRP